MESGKFTGFSRETVKFYKDLNKNNNREFFESNRSVYDKFVMEPSRKFVVEMGDKLDDISADMHAEPKINRSIFKIHRDVRFSKDKTPFKTHLALWFWDGKGKRMECSGYYFHMEPGRIMLAAGLHEFPGNILKEYRDSVVDKNHGKEFAVAVDKVLKKKNIFIGGQHYKKVPRGYESDGLNSDYLLYNGLYAFHESKIPDEFFTSHLLTYCYRIFRDMSPVHLWLYKMLNRVK